MNPQEVESLRKQYSGRCVTVDVQRPELARMAGKMGRVKTVNFNGRAIVQFEGPDRSWCDIDPHYIIPLQEESP